MVSFRVQSRKTCLSFVGVCAITPVKHIIPFAIGKHIVVGSISEYFIASNLF